LITDERCLDITMAVLASIWCVIAVAARPAELKGSGYIETVPTHAVLHSVRDLLPIDIMQTSINC
jgi:hypothetical protein